jgi:hypothetical protein
MRSPILECSWKPSIFNVDPAISRIRPTNVEVEIVEIAFSASSIVWWQLGDLGTYNLRMARSLRGE